MISCDRIDELLGAWLDGELSPAQADELTRHVDGCPACRAQKQELETLNIQMKRVLQPAGPALAFQPFWAAVRDRLDEAEGPQHSPWTERVRGWFGGFSLAWAVPAVIALLLVVYSLAGHKDESLRNNFASVESIDAYGRNVALLRENETKTTVIWLYQNQEGENDSAGEASDKSPTF